MLNQTVLVGRLFQDPEIKELENNRKVVNITLAVPRSYKNENGEYETDFIPVVLWNVIAENTKEYCKKGDIVGVKGRLQSVQMASGYSLELIAEKVTYLSSTSNN